MKWFKVATRSNAPGRWRAALALTRRDLRERVQDHPDATRGWRWQLIKIARW